MGDLSVNFSKSEFACKCGCGQAPMSMALIGGLQSMRDRTGRPITVTSGYRCIRHNKAIGGSPRSQHMVGTAADIRIAGLSVKEMFMVAESVSFFRNGGIGVYPDEHFIHADVRMAYTRWGRRGGQYMGLAEALA